MKRYITILLLAFAFVAVPSCKEIQNEIDELYDELEELKKDNESFRQQLDGFNNSLSSLQKIIAAMQSGAYIKSVMPLLEDGSSVGYIFTLSNGEVFNVRDGKDGIDGYMPMIGVTKDDHDNYWWTLDGQPVLDENGQKVKVDGAMPQMDIRDGFWFVSYDKGKNWIKLGEANGSDGQDGLNGDQLFSSVEYTEGANVVRFILADESVLVLPCYQAISISFNAEGNRTGISAGETIKVDYTLSYGDEKTVVTASTDGNYIARVEKKNNVSGTIIITCPGLYMDGYVNVMAFDGVGYSSVGVISFFEKEMRFGESLDFHVSTDSGIISVPVDYNFEYYVEVDQSSTWLTLNRTRSDFEHGTIEFSYSENKGSARVGYVNIYPSNTVGTPYARIKVTQEAAYFNLEKSSIVSSSDGGSWVIRIASSRAILFSPSASWIKGSLEQGDDGHDLSLGVEVERNTEGSRRSGRINIIAADDKSPLGSIEVIQMGEGGNDAMDLVLEVRVGEMNDFTAYLPVSYRDSQDAFSIDWGDGEYSSVDSEHHDDFEKYSRHEYRRTEEARTYEVRISGRVSHLYSGDIDEGKRSSIISVMQWGNIGLVDMEQAFSGFTSLESLADDEALCFAEVKSFNSAFDHLPRLKSIPSGLFAHARKAGWFERVFYGCNALEEVPDGLFSNCSSAVWFHSAFADCASLERIGNGLFAGCIKAENFESVFVGDRKIKSIPDDLFSNVVSATNFHGTFELCEGIEEIPAGLFDAASKALSFESTFAYTSIRSIPEDLFKYCRDAYSFQRTFHNCHELQSIPSGLFDYNRKVTSFESTFSSSENITGETPFTIVDGRKVHLYERYDNPDHFVTPIVHTECFAGNENYDDIQYIPDLWR